MDIFSVITMSFNKISFEESLAVSVIKSGKCIKCGACVIVCPFNCLEYLKEEPTLVKECKVCGICAKVCPKYDWPLPKLESFVFGRERTTEEEFGIYRRLVVAQAIDNKILNVSQDGGIVTTLLLHGLENGFIDSAIVSGISKEKPFFPAPKLATTPNEILECAGTRYFYSPNILALTDGIKQKKEKIAFVGTPCQIHAVRNIQMTGLKKYSDPLKFLIGLMCSECFVYEGLMEKHIHETLGLDLYGIRKMNIKGKMLVATETEVKIIPLGEIKQYTRKSCSFCNDFSSELADISVGGLGLDGWTFTIIRTERGEELFSNAEKARIIRTRDIAEETNALNLLCKLSRKKKQSLPLKPTV
jgi:coenzyme F420 hydrogenase subunit beta